jgi:6-phosphogluconolactonase (cycloisomerase 2 family)
MSSRFHLVFLLAALAPSLIGQSPRKTVLYAAVGADITQYDLDPKKATLTRRGSVTLPANVQEACVLAAGTQSSNKYFYVAWSNGGASYSGAPSKGDHHGIGVFRIDPESGALLPHGAPASLPSRPIFITTDTDGAHVITAHNDPSGLSVYRILPDGTVGTRVEQPAGLDFGIYGHQVRVDPSGQTVILVTRGNGPTAAKPEDPGALKIFSYKDGVLANRLSIAPEGGFGYQVRHLDFHPSGKWVFVTLERQNQIHVYRRMPDGTLGASPLFARSTLMKDTKAGPDQTAASIHVHPNGKFVYVANRGSENSIAVFSINQETGEPTLIQSIDTRGFQPRTFALDSRGTILAVANQSPLGKIAASIALFRVLGNGKLEFARKYDVETSADRILFWTGIFSLP